MKPFGRFLTILALLLAPAMPGALAAGGSAKPSTPSDQQTPEELAADHYNRGLKLRDKAWDFEEKARAAATDEQRAKLEEKAQKQFERAIEEFRASVQLDPNSYQAYSSLGYALRKTDEFSSSLESYDRALAIKPDYAEAIEYRAEAYLGLNRVDDAKQAYVDLFGHDRARADELLAAMKRWIDQRRAKPEGVDRAVVDELAGWVSEREEIAAQTPSVSQLKDHSW